MYLNVPHKDTIYIKAAHGTKKHPRYHQNITQVCTSGIVNETTPDIKTRSMYLTNPTFQYAAEFGGMEAPRLPSYNHEVGYIWANYVTS